MPLLHTDPTLKTIFPEGCMSSAIKRNQSLKELLAPSLYPDKKVSRTNSITSCNKCDICKNYLKYYNYFTCSFNNRKNFIWGVLYCNRNNVIYSMSCKNCLKQCLGSAINFKIRFRFHKNDIKINSFFSFSRFKVLNNYMKMSNILMKFMLKGKIRQSHLFTTTHDMNSLTGP